MSVAEGREEDKGADLEPTVPLATDEAVMASLADFVLLSKLKVSPTWVGKAVRRALAIAEVGGTNHPMRPGNAAVQQQLTKVAESLDAAAVALFSLDWWSESAIWNQALEEGDTSEVDCGEFGIITQPTNYRRYKDIIDELEWASNSLRRVSVQVPQQKRKWRQSAVRTLRLERGRVLATIFETAFGEPVTANNWPSDAKLPGPTPFMIFYQRIVAVAFNEIVTPDLSAVLKQTCRRHRVDPFVFGAGLIPTP